MPAFDYACRECGVMVTELRPVKHRDVTPKCREGCGVYTVRVR